MYSFTHTVDPRYLWRDMNRTDFMDRIYDMVQAASGRIEVEGAEKDIYESALLTYSPWPFIDHGDKNKIALGSVSIL